MKPNSSEGSSERLRLLFKPGNQTIWYTIDVDMISSKLSYFFNGAKQ